MNGAEFTPVRAPGCTLISFSWAIWLLKSLFVWKLTILSTPKFTWCLLFPWNVMCLLRTKGLIIRPSLGVIRVCMLLGKGLSSSPPPCATPSTHGEPKAQRSGQGVKGHPLHTSVKCCMAPAAHFKKGYSHQGHAATLHQKGYGGDTIPV